MLSRVYRPTTETIRKSYFGCSVDPTWYNFQNFARWFYNQTFCDDETYQVDKDLIVEGNRIYSPDLCCLIPQILNNALGFIKTNKLALGVHKENDKFVAETRMKSSLIRRLGVYDTLEEARLRYL